jgi:hypothetical protein
MSNCDLVAARSLIDLAGASHPRATRGYGLDPTKSISGCGLPVATGAEL